MINTMQLKRINTELLKSALKEMDSGTKNSLSDATGLSVATCRNILNELVETGEVKEIELSESTGGRPSRRFVYNQNYAFIAVMYARVEGGVKSLFSGVYNLTGQTLHEYYQDFDSITLKEIDETVSALVDGWPAIKVLSMGIPGVIQNGSVTHQCDLPSLCSVPLVTLLSEKYGLTVSLENDMNCTALGYYNNVRNETPESMVYIYYPYEGNAGAGIIVNGRVLRGHTDFAGEVSYMPLGFAQEEQGQIQSDHARFAELVVKTVLSVNCLINPETIILSGYSFSQNFRDEILFLTARKACGHVPHIVFEKDIHDSYLLGLQFLGQQMLTCDFEIIRRSI